MMSEFSYGFEFELALDNTHDNWLTFNKLVMILFYLTSYRRVSFASWS